MNICVFGAASSVIDDMYIKAIEEMGECLAKKGHALVFGAGGQGLMGAAARGFKKGNGKITGVIPHFFKEADIELIYNECDDLIFTDTMRERKAKMEDEADAFVIVPGGIGTFEEFFEVLTLKQLGRHNKPIVIYSVNDYYRSLEATLDNSVEEKFIYETVKDLYGYVTSLDSLVAYLEENKQFNYTVKDLKNG